MNPDPASLSNSGGMPGRGVSVALGGGGARGVAHLGVLQAIRESDVRVDHICGVSIGALAGALWILEPDDQRVQQQVQEATSDPPGY